MTRSLLRRTGAALAACLLLQAGAAAADVTAGDITIAAPFARATLPNAPVGGGFLTLSNTGTQDDRLIGASSDIAGRMEIHEMEMEGDVMRMRALSDGLPIPAGESLSLAPGGAHLMFMDLQGALVEGETVTVTLTFETAGEVTLPLAIGAPDAGGAPGRVPMDHGAMSAGSDVPSPDAPAVAE